MDHSRPSSAIVVGGGVIGLCTACELAKAGLEVTLLEAQRVGSGASHGNGGWITPSLSTPLAAPGATRHALTWLLRRDSPFTIRPRPTLGELAWYLNFLRSCATTRFQAGLEALLALNSSTFAEYDRLRTEGVEFEMHETGLLFAACTSGGLAHARHLRELLAGAGCDGIGEQLDGDALRSIEPAFSAAVRGGFVAASERHVRPDTLVRGLATWLRGAGVRIEEGCEVSEVHPLAGRGWRVRTTLGTELSADRLVVAAGPATMRMVSRQVDRRLRLLPAKGYSVTAAGLGQLPKRAAYLVEARVGCSPFEDGVRLAGTLELGADSTTIGVRRLAAVSAAAERYYESWRPTDDRVEWAGLRTLASDTLPLIGEVPGHPGLFLATAHGLLGVTLAPVTGAAVRSLMLDDVFPSALRPFALDRLGPRQRS